ncbi:MAG: Serine-pyruvate aminotransferase [Deltaproteobacteria bacterium]|jgi:aspartate aminotransferase-like enzyme|nr:Serine-pyruvate aminotransferase [Deltaproteobacteria bacterium]
MSGIFPEIDSDGLLEFSVVYTDRSLNHMSESFQTVMKDISSTLKKVYNANSIVVVPGSGTFGMEAVARQFASGKKCLVIRNGWFSFRWSQIFEKGKIPSQSIVLKARQVNEQSQSAFAPASIEEVVAVIKDEKPDLVFAPHVETASGIMLPENYIRAVSDAIHSVGGLFVLDCIASGTIWVDMKKTGVDVIISAPQKGWSSSPCCALVMLSEIGRKHIELTDSSSFAADLLKWLNIMETYENGGHAYHATMPTDSLYRFWNIMKETEEYGFEKVRAEQLELGDKIRTMLEAKGLKSVAAEGYKAPGVVVSYTDDKAVQSGQKFADLGIQIAAGVPLQCDEPEDFQTFRLGLFGLEKLHNITQTVERLEKAINQII